MRQVTLILLSIIAVVTGVVALITLPLIGSYVVTLSGWYWWVATLAVICGLIIVLVLAGRGLVRLWADSRERRCKLKEWVDEPVEIVGVSMFLFGVIVAVLGVWYLHLQEGGTPKGICADLVSDFYANISVDFISVGIAVLFINRLYEQRSEQRSKLEEKQRIIDQLRSSDADRAKDALRTVIKNGWHEDGSLRGANLVGADLREAYLSHADLRGASLVNADLREAYLSHADLRGASLVNADLREATLFHADLRGADLEGEPYLSDGELYPGDDYANLLGSTYDQDTQWPVGFDPEKAGAVYDPNHHIEADRRRDKRLRPHPSRNT